MRVMAIDPGGTNGIAWFDDNYQLESFAHVKLANLPEWLSLHKPKPDIVIVENFRLWKHMALRQAGSHMPASQGIGIIKSYCFYNGIQLVEQSPQILQTAVLMSQMPLPKDHSKSHWVSAYNHAFWWLVQNGYREVEMEETDK